MLLTKNLEQIQEDIRQKVTEQVRIEQVCQKQQTEIKTLKERTRSYEDEIGELKCFIDKLKKDVVCARDENCLLQQEAGKFKSAAFKLQHELDIRKDQEKLVLDQLAASE